MPLQIIRQDITKMKVDAIVNTTNKKMIGYSGIDKAVHTIAGPEMDAECATLVPLGLGQAKITGGYGLPCKYVIHTSGPVWRGGLIGESAILRSCYIESLKLALQSGCQTVAIPLISSGAHGFPKDQVLKFAIQTITEFLFDNELTVYLCVFDRESYAFSQKLFDDIQDFIDGNGEKFQGNAEEDPVLDSFPQKIYCTIDASYAHPPKSLQDYMKENEKSFGEKLFALIDESGMSDVECYKKANVDKKTFSKIKCNPKTYKPSKQTAVAFAIALRLDLDATQDLLSSAGMILSRSFTFDKIIRYFIQNENYDIFEINEALFEFDQVLLGCVNERI